MIWTAISFVVLVAILLFRLSAYGKRRRYVLGHLAERGKSTGRDIIAESHGLMGATGYVTLGALEDADLIYGWRDLVTNQRSYLITPKGEKALAKAVKK